MSDFYDEKYRLQDYINKCNSEAREYNGGASKCLRINLEYETSLSPDYAEFLDDFEEVIDKYSDKIASLYKKVNNKYAEYKDIFGYLDNFYGSDLPKIKNLYQSKKFEEAYDFALQIEKRLNQKTDEISKKAALALKLTIFELCFSLAETTKNDDFNFIKDLLVDFADNLDIIDKKRAASVASLIIDNCFTLAKKENDTAGTMLEFYFSYFMKARAIYDVYKEETTEVISKHISLASGLVDDRFKYFYFTKMDISSLLLLQSKVKKFPFKMRPKNTLILAEQSRLTEEFFTDNGTKLSPEQFKDNIQSSLAQIFNLQKKDNFYNKTIRAKDSILAIVNPFIQNEKLLNTLKDEFLAFFGGSGYMHICGDLAEKYTLESLVFKTFNKWVKDNILDKKVGCCDLCYYVKRVLGLNSLTKKQVKNLSEDKRFAYEMNLKFFNNNKAVVASKNIDLEIIRKCKKIAGIKYSDEMIDTSKQEKAIASTFKFKPVYTRIIEKISFIVLSVCFATFAIFASFAQFNLTFHEHLPTFAFLEKVPPFVPGLISGACVELIFLGLALLTMLHEGKNSIAHYKNGLIIDITNLSLVSLGLLSMIFILIFPNQVFLGLIAIISMAIGLIHIPTAIVLRFKDKYDFFRKESILRIISLSITFIMLVMILILGFLGL